MYLDRFNCKGKPYLRIVENYTAIENGKKKGSHSNGKKYTKRSKLSHNK